MAIQYDIYMRNAGQRKWKFAGVMDAVQMLSGFELNPSFKFTPVSFFDDFSKLPKVHKGTVKVDIEYKLVRIP